MSSLVKSRESALHLLPTSIIPPAEDPHDIAAAGGALSEDEENRAVLFHVICGDQMGDEFLVHANCSVGVMLNFIKLRLKADFHMPENAIVELFDQKGKPLELSKVDPFLRGYNFVEHRGVYFPMFYLPPPDNEEAERIGSDEALSEKTNQTVSTDNEKTGSIDSSPEDLISAMHSTSHSRTPDSRRRKSKKGHSHSKSKPNSRRQSHKAEGRLEETMYNENEGEVDTKPNTATNNKSRNQSREPSRPETALAGELQSSRPETRNKPTTTPIDEYFTAEYPEHVNHLHFEQDEIHHHDNDNPPHLESAPGESFADYHPFAGEADPSFPEGATKSRKSQTNLNDKSGRRSGKGKGEKSKSKQREASSGKSRSTRAPSKKLIEVELSSNTPSLARVAASKTEFGGIAHSKLPDHALTPEEAPAQAYTMKYFEDKKPIAFIPIVSKSFKSCVKLCKWVSRLHNEIDKGVKDMDSMVSDMVASIQKDEDEEQQEALAAAAAAAAAAAVSATKSKSAHDLKSSGKKHSKKKSRNTKKGHTAPNSATDIHEHHL